MIFKRLYNWIKFKTLPPSVLFKNRLYIERDSKTRRITSNLGLTFRNSKWTNYSRTDINLNLKTQFFNSLSVIVFLLVVFFWLTNGSTLYNTDLINNDFLFFIWYLKDICLYYCFSLVTLFTFLLTFLIEKCYTSFSGLIFTKHLQSKTLTSSQTPTIPSNHYKYIYYNWLLQSKTSWDNSHHHLFKSLDQSKNDPNYLTLLFQINNCLSRLDTNLLDTTRLASSPTFFTLKANFTTLLKQRNFQTSVESAFTPSLSVLNSRFHWNLSTLLTVLNTSSKEVLNFHDSFYITSLNFMELNNSLLFNNYFTNLNASVVNQLDTLKSHKFLYNYSFLHRKILKDSHKLTMVKRLITSGFYDSTLVTKNLWASDFFNKVTSPHNLLEGELKLLYKNLYHNTFFTNYLMDSNKVNKTLTELNLFSFYEVSYFWFLKRFYLFNNLTTNSFNYPLSARESSHSTQSIDSSTHFYKLTSMLKSHTLVNYTLDNFTNDSLNSNNLPYTSTSFKDVILLRSEAELVTLEDDSIILDLFTNSLINNSVNVFSSTTSTNNPSFSTTLTPLTLQPTSVNKSKFVTNQTFNLVFSRDLISLLKIY